MTTQATQQKLAPGTKGKDGVEICRAFRNNGSCRFEKDCKYEHSAGAAIEAPPRDYTPKGDCHNWTEKKECRFAERCRFLHGAGDKRTTYRVARPENTSGEQEICRNFQSRGKCRFGDECKHKHVAGDKKPSNNGDSKDNGGNGGRNRRRPRGRKPAGTGAGATGGSSEKKAPKAAAVAEFDKAGKEVCRNFAKGKCTRGNDCQYSHAAVASTGPAPVKPKREAKAKAPRVVPECKDFDGGKGKCEYGDECRFKHGANDKRDLTVRKRREPGACRDFAEGKCEYGTECRFKH